MTAAELLKKAFVGPGGIRAGWRLLIFVCVALLAGAVLFELVRFAGFRFRGALSPVVAMVGEGTNFLAMLVSAVVMARLERRSLAQYGLPARGAFGREFWLGALCGFTALTVLLLVVWAGQGFTFGTLALGGKPLLGYALGWWVAFLAVGFFEEFLMRGYALYTLATGMGFWPAAILLSVVFGAGHLRNVGETWVGGLSACAIGLLFSFSVRRTGSLWFAVGLHSMWDYSESFLYSVPDSGVMVKGHLLNSSFHGPEWLTGGSVGPEGSVLVFVVIAALFVIVDRAYREVRFPVTAKAEATPSANLVAPGASDGWSEPNASGV